MSTWILLRGLTREKRHWRGFSQALLMELPGARVIELELPGNGELNGMASPSNIAAMASHCRAELAGLGIPPPYHLLAMSMGAMVATAWVVSHPEEVEACVLINTSFGAFSPVYQRFRPALGWPCCASCSCDPSGSAKRSSSSSPAGLWIRRPRSSMNGSPSAGRGP